MKDYRTDHSHLNRILACERLKAQGTILIASHEIRPKQSSQPPSDGVFPVNDAECRLRHLLQAAGFGERIRGEQLRLSPAIGTTTPDVIYRGAHHNSDEWVCIYLGSLSAAWHGKPETQEQDLRIRT